MRVEIKSKSIPEKGVAIQLSEAQADILSKAERGHYLVVDPESETFSLMTDEQMRANYWTPRRSASRRTLKKYWTETDTLLLRHLQSINKITTVPAIADTLNLDTRKAQSRLGFLAKRGLVERTGSRKTGGVYWQITEQGKRHPKAFNEFKQNELIRN